MPRWTTPLVGLAVVAFAVWLVARNFEPPQAIGHDPSPHDAGAAAASLAIDAGEDTGTLFLGDLLAMPAPRIDGGAGATLLDGIPVPPLPLNVPREVRFGVVLVSYAGAQVNTTA